MAKALITTADGISVKVEGSAGEVAQVVRNIRETSPGAGTPSRKRQTKRVLLGDLIETLADGGFFKKPKDLAGVKAALEEMGHHYPVTTLSGAMLTQVRRRKLRRLKQDRRWVYSG